MATKNKVAVKWIWIVVAAIVILAGAVTPDISGLSFQGKMSMFIMVAAIILWIADAMPLFVSAFGMVALLVLFGVLSANDAWKATMNSTILFLVGVFAFTTFLAVSTFPHRLVGKILKWSKNNSKKLLLGVMIISAIISVVMSNIALTAIMTAIMLPILEVNKCKPGESGLGKAMVLGIIIAVMLGGGLLPSGTPINVMILGLVSSTFGVEISFVQWFGIAIIPIAITLVASWWGLCFVYKPEDISDEALQYGIGEAEKLPPMDFKEKANIAIMIIALICWILSSWVPILNTTTVALLALMLMFLPGINVISVGDYVKSSPWSVLLMLMAVNALVAGMTANGAAAWIVNTALSGMASAGYIPLMIAASILLAILHNVIPAGPALAGLVTIPFVGLVAGIPGANVTAMAILCAWWCADAFLIPLDAVPLATFNYGYYKFTEMWKGGLTPTVVLIICTSFLLPLLAPLFGAI